MSTAYTESELTKDLEDVDNMSSKNSFFCFKGAIIYLSFAIKTNLKTVTDRGMRQYV